MTLCSPSGAWFDSKFVSILKFFSFPHDVRSEFSHLNIVQACPHSNSLSFPLSHSRFDKPKLHKPLHTFCSTIRLWFPSDFPVPPPSFICKNNDDWASQLLLGHLIKTVRLYKSSSSSLLTAIHLTMMLNQVMKPHKKSPPQHMNRDVSRKHAWESRGGHSVHSPLDCF